MTIENGQYLLNIDQWAFPAFMSTENGDYVIRAACTDGEYAAVYVDPMTLKDQYGLRANCTDGIDVAVSLGAGGPGPSTSSSSSSSASCGPCPQQYLVNLKRTGNAQGYGCIGGEWPLDWITGTYILDFTGEDVQDGRGVCYYSYFSPVVAWYTPPNSEWFGIDLRTCKCTPRFPFGETLIQFSHYVSIPYGGTWASWINIRAGWSPSSRVPCAPEGDFQTIGGSIFDVTNGGWGGGPGGWGDWGVITNIPCEIWAKYRLAPGAGQEPEFFVDMHPIY